MKISFAIDFPGISKTFYHNNVKDLRKDDLFQIYHLIGQVSYCGSLISHRWGTFYWDIVIIIPSGFNFI